VDEEQARRNSKARPGHFICLSVADTGCGMDEATRKRIFEPFFTTKEIGKGTGLGLATVHGIVAQHKGWIQVKSEVGHGSVFDVFLPATTKALKRPNPTASKMEIQGTETILLVEDDAPLRQLTAKSLRSWGYTVWEADSGVSAIDVWDQHDGRVDLLLSDMIMPGGLSGLDLADKLRECSPSLKVIICTGYNSEIERLAKRPMVCLQKPFEPNVLSATIRSCLDQPIQQHQNSCPKNAAEFGRGASKAGQS
jgi:CheY-like chemotaxis protein